MKNKLWLIVTIFFLMCPAVFANVPYTITLDNIQYAPSHPVIEKNGMLYLSEFDFEAITLCEFSKTEKSTLLTFGKDTIVFTPNERISKINNKSTILKDFPFTEKNIIYIPLSFLDFFKFPYTSDLATHRIVIPYQVPRSLNSDSYDNHTFLETNITLKERSNGFSALETTFINLLKNGTISNSYIAFIDNQYKRPLLDHLNALLLESPYNNLEVVFREFDATTAPHTLSNIKRLPISIQALDNNLILNINNDSITSNCIFTSYVAGKEVSAIDMDKSVDMTIMHMLYQYYRNTYDFKDDKYFVPFFTATMERSDFITYPVYTLASPKDDTHVPYSINVYRTHMKNKIRYVIDVMKK